MRPLVLTLSLWSAGCALVSDADHAGRVDVDADGLVAVEYRGGTDCDDRDPNVGAAHGWYQDVDGDGAGDESTERVACQPPLGFVATAGDCDDRDPTRYPGAVELCNGLDDDCDGVRDDGLLNSTAWIDLDLDGYGDPASSIEVCAAPAGWVRNALDCDDGQALINPGAEERCNGLDDDCDVDVDEGVPTTDWYADIDQDGFGDPEALTVACAGPAGAVSVGGDCDDTDSGVNPDARELCNERDDDCDEEVDEGLPRLSWHPDRDEDGWGDAAEVVVSCAAPLGWVDPSGDCDDGDPEVNPGAAEVCNGVDDDCDDGVDEGLALITVWPDADLDGFGDAARPTGRCGLFAPYVGNGEDCDDGDPAIRPGAEELCGDLVDQDCDGARPQCGPFGDLSAGDVAFLRCEATEDEAGAAIAAWRGQGVGLAIGAPGWNGGGGALGAVYLVAAPTAPDLGGLAGAVRLSGRSTGSRFGAALLGGVDLGSGSAVDLAIAAPRDGQGWVWFLDPSAQSGTAAIDAVATRSVRGRDQFTELGAALAGGADVDGDGALDVVIGAPGTFGGAGAAVLMSGGVDGALSTRDRRAVVYGQLGWRLGEAVALLEDFDGDGAPDLAIGAPAGAGRVLVFPGPLAAGDLPLGDAWTWTGAGSADAVGSSLAAGDVDGDGLTDLIVGAPGVSEGGRSQRGAVYVIHGAESPTTGALGAWAPRLLGQDAGQRLGERVAFVGDVDGDAVPEVAVGAPRAASDRGRAFLWSPPPSGVQFSDMLAVLPAAHMDHRVGSAVAAAGDVNGDGLNDVLIGASGSRPLGAAEGAAALWFGAPTP